MFKRASWLAAVALAIAAAGCSGSDGAQGPQGPQGVPGDQGIPGTQGPPGAPAAVSTSEQCVVCHGQGKAVAYAGYHAGQNQLLVSNQTASAAGSDVQVTFNIKVDGVNNDSYTNTSNGGYSWTYQDPAVITTAAGVRVNLPAFTVVSNGSGAYTATIPGLAASTSTRFLLKLASATNPTLATVVADYNGAIRTIISDQACMNCHGTNVFRVAHHSSTNPQGALACTVCHNVTTSTESRLGTTNTAPGLRLMGYVHGIHNSENMADGVYSRNGSASASSQFSIGFPGYIQNCSTCHDTAEALDQVINAKVSYALCISCHDGWNGFTADGSTVFGGIDHSSFTYTKDCSLCHDDSMAPATVKSFHNVTPPATPDTHNELFWDGKDQAVEIGKTIKMEIMKVTQSGTSISFDWRASVLDPATSTTTGSYDPCFAGTPTDGNPSFIGPKPRNFTALVGLAQGNDWVNANNGSAAPGQPITSAALDKTNTTCAGGVATTTLTVPALGTTKATKGIVGLQGKPLAFYAPANGFTFVRAKSPVREFVVGTGALPAAADLRRQIVSSEKCLACHNGSLFQHGGNRVDNTELCAICHNPASNDGATRAGWGITAANSFDGKVGQTFDLRTLLHKIHSAGETGSPLVIYGGHGISAFGNGDTLAYLEANKGFVEGAVVPGTGQKAGFTAVDYPRPLFQCAACHVNGSENNVPDQSKAVAVTDNAPGAAPWDNQLDDQLIGPATAACISCHSSTADRGHAYGQSWAPATFENGRQTILDAASSPGAAGFQP